METEFFNPTRIYFTSCYKIGKLVEMHHFHRVLLLCGSSYLQKSGILDRLVSKLRDRKIAVKIYSGIPANPDIENVKEALLMAKEASSDLILAIGGGSVLDTAKCVANNYYYCGDILDFNQKKAIPTKALPIATIITIAASGSEMSSSCVISDRKTGFKGGFNSSTNYPLFSILDPSLTQSVSPFQTACGLIDIISHSFERYFCPSDDFQISDLFALSVIRNIVDLTPTILAEPQNLAARQAMLLTGTVSHNGFTSFGKITSMPCHFVEHMISGQHPEIAHGLGLSWLLGPFMRRNRDLLATKIQKFGHFVFDIEDIDKILDRFDHYVASLPLLKKMADFSISQKKEMQFLAMLKPVEA